jgi:tetratricopeptide (TPR) repeat protein
VRSFITHRFILSLVKSNMFRLLQVQCCSLATLRNYSAVQALELNKRAGDLFEKGEFDAAARAWEELVSLEKGEMKPGAAPNPNLIHGLHNLACAYGEMGNTDQKMKLLQESLTMIESAYGKLHPQYAMALYNLASALGDAGDAASMKSFLLETLSVHEKLFNPNHPKVGRVLSLLTVAHERLGEYPEQLQTAQRAAAIISKHCGREHMQTALATASLGRAYGNNNDVPKMLQLVKSAFDAQEVKLGPVNPQITPLMVELAEAHGRLGEHFVRRELLEKAIEGQKRAFGVYNFHLFDVFLKLGDACRSLGDFDSSLDALMHALKIAEEKYTTSHPSIGVAKAEIALLYNRMGNQKASVSFAKAALGNLDPKHHAELFSELQSIVSLSG